MNKEYQELRVLFAQNPGANWSQIQSTIMTRQNALVQAERTQQNYQREQARLAEETKQREAEEKAVLEQNPNLLKYHQDRKDKIQQRKEKVLDAAIRFYDMDDEQANLYFNDKHKPTESAVMDLINEYLDEQKKFTIYKCNYCEKEVFSLSDLERHCWNNGHDHRDITLIRIESNAAAATGKVSAELTKDIDNAIRGKKDVEYKARLWKERAAEARAKKDLPFVTQS
jgi:hypothetical protein